MALGAPYSPNKIDKTMQINIIEIQSEINLPEVRWDVKHGHCKLLSQ